MTPPQLVGQAARLGYAVVRTESGFTLRPRSAERQPLPDWLRSRLAESKDAVVGWLDSASRPRDADPGEGACCRECSAWVYPGGGVTPADVWRACGRTRCPWRPRAEGRP